MTQPDTDKPVQYILQLLDHKGSVLAETLHDDDLQAHNRKDTLNHPWGSYIFRADRKRNKNGRLPPLPNWRVSQSPLRDMLPVREKARRVMEFYDQKPTTPDDPYITIRIWPDSKIGRHRDDFNAELRMLIGRNIKFRLVEVDPAEWEYLPTAESAAA